MGVFINDKDELKKEVEKKFGKKTNYILVFKHNKAVKSVLKLLLSKLYYIFDNTRTFVLVFDEKGIYEKEISNSDKRDFYLIPESEIENFKIEEKSNKAYISFDHIGKNISYEIPFTGKLFQYNKENFDKLLNDNWKIK